MIGPYRTWKISRLLPPFVLGLVCNLLSSCVLVDFYVNSAQSGATTYSISNDPCFTSEDLQNTAVPDPCFGNAGGGTFALSSLSSLFKPFETNLATGAPNKQSLRSLVTQVDSDGALWLAYPHRANDGDLQFQITRLKASVSDSTSPSTYITLEPNGLAITDLLIDDEDAQDSYRYVYYAGTTYTGMGNNHVFSLCRLRENRESGNLTEDTSFYSGGHCRRLSSANLGGGYAPLPASEKPVRMAFHTGSDGVRRVVLIGISSNAGTEHITLIPIRVTDGSMAGPGSLNSPTSFAFNTNGQGDSFDLSGAARSIRIFGFESDLQEGAFPSTIYVAIEFFHDVDSGSVLNFV